MKLQITVSGGTTTFLWMYTQDGIDFQAKGLQMTFEGNVLTTMTDGYFLFTVGSTNLATSQQRAITIAEDYVKTLTWTIEGQQVSGFNVKDGALICSTCAASQRQFCCADSLLVRGIKLDRNLSGRSKRSCHWNLR